MAFVEGINQQDKTSVSAATITTGLSDSDTCLTILVSTSWLLQVSSKVTSSGETSQLLRVRIDSPAQTIRLIFFLSSEYVWKWPNSFRYLWTTADLLWRFHDYNWTGNRANRQTNKQTNKPTNKQTEPTNKQNFAGEIIIQSRELSNATDR